MSNVSTSASFTQPVSWVESFTFNPESGCVTPAVSFEDLHKCKLVGGAAGHPPYLILREAYWGRWVSVVARSLLVEAAHNLPQWAVEALHQIAKTGPVLGKANVSIVGPGGLTGEFTVPVDWGFIMGDVEDNLEEKSRVGRLLEQKTGLRFRFCQYDWPTDSAVYYV